MTNKISSSDLPKVWLAPDNTRLTSKQISIRLPVHVAASVSALEKIYSNKTRTQIINDLLSTALQEIGESMPSEEGEVAEEIYRDDVKEMHYIYEEAGLRKRYYDLYNEYLYDLEKEMGNEGEVIQYIPLIIEGGAKYLREITKK